MWWRFDHWAALFYFSCCLPTLGCSSHKSQPYFFVPRFRNSIGCNCNAIMITAGPTTFSLIENRKIQLNAISPRCQTNTGDLEISTSFECLMCAVKLMCCACLIWLDIPPASSIALFFSETKWQFKRWIVSVLHSKSSVTRSPAHLEAKMPAETSGGSN